MYAHNLFIVFSSTPNKMGKFIRCITGNAYNHISISFDENLSVMYSFARRYYRTPLYGGFVTEQPSRYHIQNRAAEIEVCKIPLSSEDYILLSNRITDMQRNRDHFLYNYFSAIAALFHKSYPVPDAYICSEFCASILKDIHFPLPNKKYLSISHIRKCLQPYYVYSGQMFSYEDTDPQYFAKHPLPKPFLATLRSIVTLMKRSHNKNLCSV